MTDNSIQNIELNISSKQKFTIDGNADKVIELDTNDLTLINRLKEGIVKIDSIQTKWNELSGVSQSEDLDTIIEFSDEFSKLENDMRNIVDNIFDCEGMCNIILGKTSIFSPVNGRFKYEQIISTLCGLYEDTIQKETEKLDRRRIENKTAKYVHK